ncbi:MAG: SPFH domain-containing protein [Clostridiales bacterium]|nr:SPFH domain-containing protein [Candidatus Apopatousia equi]
MGLFSGIKRQLLKVIEWKDDSKDTVVYRYPLTDRDEIMTSSTLVVRESQCAIFVHKGEIADIFGPGTYKLSTENIPFLTKLLSLPQGFESKIKAEVYYVNTKQFTGLKWGTQNPIMMRDKEFGNVRIRGFGIYSFKVEDPKVFMKEMFGTNALYKVADIGEQCRPMLIESITDAIAESKISALDLAANYKEFAETILKSSEKGFSEFGLKLCSIVVENLSLPEEVEQMLDERTKMGVMEDKMGTYTQMQAAQAMRDAAKNPNGGNLAGLGVGLGAGSVVGNLFAQNLTTENKPKAKMTVCDKCGAEMKEGSKFCPECGKKQGFSCPKCGASVSKNAKFCPECGEKLVPVEKTCECGAKLKDGVKFCPECGKKVE